MTYVSKDGETFTEADLARWAADAEAGFPQSIVTPTSPRAWELESDPMVTKTVRVPKRLWARVERAAASRGMTASQFMRQALAEELSR